MIAYLVMLDVLKGATRGGKVMDLNTQIKLELLFGTPDT